MERRKLPIGIQTFREIREDGHYYVDKTPHIRRLIDEGKHYFLSRPRRFGKSLLLSTIEALFEGREELFRGLAIHDEWDWSVRRPVLRLDFSRGNFMRSDRFEEHVVAQLNALAGNVEVALNPSPPSERFHELIETLHRRTGRRVAVLVDEYDKPILDVLGDPETARTNRNHLAGLYGTVKSADAHIRFSFFTGVSKFFRVNLFSGLNNLFDITLHPRYSSICGYTEHDLDTVFAPELEGLDRDAVREWYNGYGWLGEETLYNPYAILLLFKTREFEAHWFETGTPSFLLDTLSEHGVLSQNLDGLLASKALLSSFEVGNIAPEALLFQTGYLTIREKVSYDEDVFYRLGYPNREVRQSLNKVLLPTLEPGQETFLPQLRTALKADDFPRVEALVRSYFAGIPHEWHLNVPLARFEAWYASVLYSLFVASGLVVTAEDSTSTGRADMTIRVEGGRGRDARVHVFELKVVERSGPGAALAQLREKGYADKYRDGTGTVWLIGVEFSEETRNVATFEVERA